MIVTELYKGQGLGNQLACYIATRTIAIDNGYDFGIMHPERFKGVDFLDLDFGKKVTGGKGPEGGPPEKLPDGIKLYYNERRIIHPINGADIRLYDKNLINILDNTKIDGLMQDEQYFSHRKNEIRKWLKVNEKYECYDYSDDNICVINFRGGEYVRHKDFFLNENYWKNAVSNMIKINKNFKFVVVTDDIHTAKKFFPNYEVLHNMARDYVIIKNAKYLILSNSSFAWFPAWLNENLKLCIAPKYWGRHNISDGYWSCGYNITRGWMYQDRNGKLCDYDTCLKELDEYIKNHSDYFPEMKIRKNFLVISNYNNDLRWVPEYTDNYIIYNKRSDILKIPESIDPKRVISSSINGYNSYDYFTFIIDNYENLPDCIIFAKGWSFPRHVRMEHFHRIMNNDFFTPIEDWKMHKPKFPIAFFSPEGGYCEINNSWYLKHWKTKYFTNYNDFLRFIYKDPVIPRYTRFAPGGDYIVPKANILKLPKVVYQNLRLFLSHCQEPGETHMIERAMYTLWASNFELSNEIQKPLDENFRLSQTRDLKKRLEERSPLWLKKIISWICKKISRMIPNRIKNLLIVYLR